jgi:hypothetical protein
MRLQTLFGLTSTLVTARRTTLCDLPQSLIRRVQPGGIRTAADDAAMVQNNAHFTDVWHAIERPHNAAHGHIGGTLADAHLSFRDPFVFFCTPTLMASLLCGS